MEETKDEGGEKYNVHLFKLDGGMTVLGSGQLSPKSTPRRLRFTL